MNNRPAILESIYAQLTDPARDGTAHIDDPTWVDVLMTMTPSSEPTRRGESWVESRSERLDGSRTVFAVISRDDGQLSVTAHIDAWVAVAERCCRNDEIFCSQRGVQVRNMNALELLHRTVVNEHGAVFHVGALYLDSGSGRIVIDLLELDENGEPIPGTECGVDSLDGWEVH